MKVTQLNAWLQVLANLGVVAGLLFLGLQLRQNSRMMAAQTRNELTQSIITLIQMESDPRVVSAYLKRDSGLSLTPEDSYHLEAVANATLRHWENTFYQHRNGLFDNIEYQADTQVWAMAMKEPAYQSHWKKMRNTYSPDFRGMIDRYAQPEE